MKIYSRPRKKIPQKTAVEILLLSGRRCALCFGINFDLSEKKGQIAHLDRNRENNKIKNLVFLCLEHADAYDMWTSQSKRYTQEEVMSYREQLYEYINDKKSMKGKTGYKYNYFNKISYFVNKEIIDEEARIFLNKLDENKRMASQYLSSSFKDDDTDINRLQKINDYLFKIYRDLWFIQKKWRENKSRYFQGKITMAEIPDYLSDARVEITGLSDQADDWEDIGYTEEYAPLQLECHVYAGPSGHGFTVFARIKINGDIWQNKMHIGPESYREKDNFTWIKLAEEF